MEKIITTLTSYPGKKILKVIKIVSAYDNSFKAHSSLYNVDECLETALENLYNKSLKVGGNAVLGVQYSLSESNNPFLIGTAVVLEDE